LNFFLSSSELLIKIKINLDPNKWVTSSGAKSVPVQIKIESKNNAGTGDIVIFSYTQFKPFLALQEEDYFVIFLSPHHKKGTKSVISIY
jgi:hypothetical protein